MTDVYPILRLPDDAPEDIEQMGSKEKFWFRHENDRWLFKYPRGGTGEHWAEKIVAEIAILLQIPVARVELAVFQNKPGSATLTFADRSIGRALIHGNELLATLVRGYQKDKWHHQNDHTLDRIIDAVQSAIPKRNHKSALKQLAGYVVLDALVGNTDRHHENWGILLKIGALRPLSLEVAPSFDHASSLGRELTVEKCRTLLETSEGVARYIEKGHGGIYLNTLDAKGPSPLRLCLEAVRQYPDYFGEWQMKLADLDMTDVERIVSRVPDSWISDEHRALVCALVSRSRATLLEG